MLNTERIKASVDVVALLEHYGASFYSQDGSRVRCNCIVHGGHNTTSLVYDQKYRSFKCWGKCGFKGDVIALVQAVEHCSFQDAVESLRPYMTLEVSEDTDDSARLNPDKKWTETLESVYGNATKNAPLRSPMVEKAMTYAPNPYTLGPEPFLPSTVEHFGVGYCDDARSDFNGRAIIPIHDEDGTMVGYSGRLLSKSGRTLSREDGASVLADKYRIKAGFKKGLCLYNLHRAKEHISRKSPLVIVEGFKSVWRLYEAGVYPVVALMGKDPTAAQYSLILRYATSVILGLDFDEAGRAGTRSMLHYLSGKIDVKVLPTKYPESPDLDLGSMSPVDARWCWEHAGAQGGMQSCER